MARKRKPVSKIEAMLRLVIKNRDVLNGWQPKGDSEIDVSTLEGINVLVRLAGDNIFALFSNDEAHVVLDGVMEWSRVMNKAGFAESVNARLDEYLGSAMSMAIVSAIKEDAMHDFPAEKPKKAKQKK